MAQRTDTHTVSPWFQIACMLVTSLVVTVIIYFTLQRFQSFETHKSTTSLSEKAVLFVSQKSSVPVIESGVFVRDISNFDSVHGRFSADLLVWFRFNPSLISPALVEKFVLERAEEKNRSDAIVQVSTKDEYVVKYYVRLNYSVPFNYVEFPVDDHRIDFVLTNYFLDSSRARFETNEKFIILNPDIQIEGWKILEKTAQVGYLENPITLDNPEKTIYYPRMVFGFDLERDGIRQVLSTVLPLLVIFFTALFTFAINPIGADYYNVIALSVASVMALVAYRFVIETVSPATGYFTISDYIFLFFLILTLIILFINTLGSKISSYQKSVTTVLLHAATIIVFVILFRPWL